jgi:hypothetical protein
MTHKYLITTLAVVSALALSATSADAQRRRTERRAVPRAAAPPVVRIQPRVVRPQIVTIVPHRYYSPRSRAGLYYGYPRYGYARPRYGYRYPAYGYAAPGYFAPVPGRRYGGVRIDLPQRDAQVFVGGYFVGTVDEFDGVFQQLNLEPGAHRIEIRAPEYEPIVFDVRVEPGKTITYRASMRPLYP